MVTDCVSLRTYDGDGGGLAGEVDTKTLGDETVVYALVTVQQNMCCFSGHLARLRVVRRVHVYFSTILMNA